MCESGRRRAFGLTAWLLCALAGQASAGGGVILERSSLSGEVQCRQGAVQWLGAGGTRCPGEEQAQTTAARAPRGAAAGAEPGRVDARRRILQQELVQERARLASLQLGAQESAAAGEAFQRARQDVLALERELARLPP